MPRLPRWLRRMLVPFVGAQAVCVSGGWTEVLAAGNSDAKIMLMGLAPTTKNACGRAVLRPSDCRGYDSVNNLPLYPTLYFAYALVVQGSTSEGVSGASFGIDYDGVLQSGIDIWEWQSCADTESPDAGWPGAGTGNVLNFNAATNCQTTGNANIGAVAVLGYFYSGAYTPDVFRVTPHPDSGVGTVLNCAAAADTVHQEENVSCTHFGALGFGPGGNGINPCDADDWYNYCNPRPPVPCVEGPPVVTVGTTTTYRLPEWDWPYSGLATWTVTGPAQIVGHDQYWREVDVLATGPGTYTLRPMVCPYDVPHVPCSNCAVHSVVVEEAVPAVPTTWGRIKVLVR